MTEKTDDLIASALQALADKQLGEAYANIEKIAAADPESAITQHILGLLALYTSEPVEALRFFNAAYDLAPSIHEHAEALAITYARLGKLHDALFFAKLSPALAHSPTPGLLPAWLGVFADHFLNIKADPLLQAALALQAEGKLAEAERMFRREITLNPHSMDGWRGLAATLNALGRPFDALMALQGLVSAGPAKPWDIATIGHTMAQCGRHDQAAALYARAVRQAPDDAGIGAARIADLRYNPAITAASLAAAAESWRAGTSAAQKDGEAPYIEPLEGRKLRVGLLSGRLSVATAPLNALSMFLQRGEQVGWELTVFNLARQDDALTRRLRHIADDWIDFAEIDDATAALMIENVAVDVLVALDDVGTNARAGLLLERPNCLVLAFAQPPAVAAAFGADGVIVDQTLAAGLPAFDTIVAATRGALYGLPEDVLPVLPPRGADEPRVIGLRAGRADLNPTNCAILADLLAALPDALLLLDASRLGGEAGFEDLLEQFVWYGCSDRIVTMADIPPGDETMHLFAAMDVLLDLGPVNDVESAMAALLLGRPVATMSGDTPAGRTTASALTGLGLADWIAQTPAELGAIIGSMLSEDGRDMARQRAVDAVAGGAEARPLARAKVLAAALRELVASRQAA
jgi:predicted O-linked N-acetylglucosamine transferase (SPINDLY family)